MDGDKGQAKLVRRNVGDKGSTISDVETFQTRYVLPPSDLNVQNQYGFQCDMYSGVILS